MRPSQVAAATVLSIVLVCGLGRADLPQLNDTPERVVAEIEKLGGRIIRDEAPRTARVVSVDLSGCDVTDDILAQLKVLTSLELLDLSSTRVEDSGLAASQG